MKYQILTLPITSYRLWLWRHSFGNHHLDRNILTKLSYKQKTHWFKKKTTLVKDNYLLLVTLPTPTNKFFSHPLSIFSSFLGDLVKQFSQICTLWSFLNTLTKASLRKVCTLSLVSVNQKLSISYYLKSFQQQLKLL